VRAQVALLHAIRSPSKPLRHVVGTNVAVIVGVGGLPTWPELLMSLVQCLESNDRNALEGALDALYKVRRPEPNLAVEPAHAGDAPARLMPAATAALAGRFSAGES
jgi:transportin-1